MPDAILLVGEITPSSPSDFRKALKAQPKAKILVLGSEGGVLPAAIKIAGDVKRRGMSTVIPSKFGCYSACAYIYFAGREHMVTGKLGVHRASTGTAGDDASAYFSSVKGQLAQFSIPEPVMRRIEGTSPNDMYVFSRKEIASLSLNRVSGPNSRVVILAKR